MAVAPKIVRVNKHKDRHGKLSSVEYFYNLHHKQRQLLTFVISHSAWTTSAWADYTAMIRRILRTNEYSELDQEALGQIRTWYISNK